MKESEAAVGDPAEFERLEPQERDAWDAQVEAVRRGTSVAITLAGTSHDLSSLPDLSGNLLDLLLDGGGVKSNDIESIAAVGGLFHLRIRQVKLTDQNVSRLAGESKPSALSASLEILNLPQSDLSSVGIQHLSRFPKLRQLRLGGGRIDDAAARAFADLPSLESLHLIGPQMSGTGLRALVNCNKLSSLYIDDCPLPDSAWEALFAAKPNLHVHVDQAHHDRDPKAHQH
ncbi:MAG: hypothetical protein ACE361_07740 [Aureliella sp.]